jgi:hypothetical protein
VIRGPVPAKYAPTTARRRHQLRQADEALGRDSLGQRREIEPHRNHCSSDWGRPRPAATDAMDRGGYFSSRILVRGHPGLLAFRGGLGLLPGGQTSLLHEAQRRVGCLQSYPHWPRCREGVVLFLVGKEVSRAAAEATLSHWRDHSRRQGSFGRCTRKGLARGDGIATVTVGVLPELLQLGPVRLQPLGDIEKFRLCRRQ